MMEATDEGAGPMNSKLLVAVQWTLLVIAIITWVMYLRGDMETVSVIVASISSVVFGVLFCYQLFD
tara:strand:- start:8820 stop:9017 length:198 start_codon:yes stop_codon:yes gene_type:complete